MYNMPTATFQLRCYRHRPYAGFLLYYYYFVVIGLMYKASPRLPATPAQAEALPREGASTLGFLLST